MDETTGTSDPSSSAGTTTATPPEPAPQPQYRRLMRRPERGMIAGVAAGLGEHFSVDPLIFRIAFVVAVLAGGLGILAYLLLWWLVPSDESGDDPHDRFRSWFRGLPTWVGIGLLIVGAAAVSEGFGIWHPAIFWGVVLIGLGVLLFAHTSDPERQRLPREARASRRGATAVTQPLPPPGYPTVPQPLPKQGYATVAPRPARRERRERSSLGWITLGAVLLAVGIAALLDTSGAVDMTPVRYPALILTVIGLGLAVGARWGRARWLILPAVLLLPFVLAMSFVDVPLQGGFGSRYFRPGTTAEIAPTYRLVAGQMVLDLSDVRLGSTSKGITATVAAGDLRVLVPSNVALVVDASSGAGVVDLFHRQYPGIRVHVDRTFSPREAAGRLVLHLHTGLGRVGLYHDRSGVPL
jgi:phage shock protein PspC (stress-responsive transcriptional regulator)